MDKTNQPLSEEIAAFMQRGVSVVVASRDANLQPSLARAYACYASPDRTRVTIVVAPSQCAALLADIRTSRKLTLAVTEPSTHRTYQLKADDATVQPVRAFDHACCDTHTEIFIEEVRLMGHSEALVRAIMDTEENDRIAISFTPQESFNQTPGPAAGARLA